MRVSRLSDSIPDEDRSGKHFAQAEDAPRRTQERGRLSRLAIILGAQVQSQRAKDVGVRFSRGESRNRCARGQRLDVHVERYVSSG